MKKYLICFLLVNFVWAWAEGTDVDKAIHHFQQGQWAKAVKADQRWVKKNPEDQQAWLRLARSHIHLKQGKPALDALKKLTGSQQIPASFTAYLNAQAHALTGDKEKAMKGLRAAVNAGLRQYQDLQNNPVWDGMRELEEFKTAAKTIHTTLNPCLYDERYRAFDFWLGKWAVYGNLEKTGSLFGHNTISQTEQGCLIMEQWQGAGGSTGTSMNYYDGIKDQWVQRWVSGGGTVIEYSGGLDGNAMKLVGKIYYAQQEPQIRDFRGTWTPLEGGVVQQFFEESVDGGQTWYTWFNGYYFPVKKEDEE